MIAGHDALSPASAASWQVDARFHRPYLFPDSSWALCGPSATGRPALANASCTRARNSAASGTVSIDSCGSTTFSLQFDGPCLSDEDRPALTASWPPDISGDDRTSTHLPARTST